MANNIPAQYIHERPELDTITGNESIPLSTGVAASKRTTFNKIKDWFLSLTGLSFKENITFEKQIVSTVATGTVPISSLSLTKCNLNVEELNGKKLTATTGHLPFVSGGNLANSSMFQDVNGNVGIGTTAPKEKLDTFGAVIFGKNDYSIQGIQKVLELRADGINAVAPPSSFRWYTTPGYNNGNALSLRSYDVVLGETADIMTIRYGNVGIGATIPFEKLEVAGISRAENFKKNAFFVTKNLAASANITSATAVNIQMNASTDYEYVISTGITATLNFNDASFQYNSITMVYATGGTALKLTSPGVTFYQNGAALVGDVVSGYDGTKLNEIGIKVLSATKFLVARG